MSTAARVEQIRTGEPSGEVHPAAAVFPMLPDDEMRALADSIKAIGLLQPIVLTPDGAVLDGRNRLAACKLARVRPTYVVHEGDPVEFVAASNVNRRHMTTGARAMAVAVMLADAGRRANGRWARGSVPDNRELPNSAWRDAMTDAGAVVDHAPDLSSAVIAGAMSLHAAHEAATAARQLAESFDERFARLPADLAALVRDEQLPLEEAEAAAVKREVKRLEERRDARALLTRVLDLVAPANLNPEFADSWAAHLGEVEADVVDRVGCAIDVLTDLKKAIEQ